MSQLSKGQNALALVALAAAYWLASQFVIGITLSVCLQPITHLQQAFGWPAHARPYMLSGAQELILIFGSLPFAGIVALIDFKQKFVAGLIVALPATLWLLLDLQRIAQSGLPVSSAVYGLAAIDATKLLLTLPLLTLLAARFMGRRRQRRF